MFGSAILDVAIGLTFLYFLMSMIVSHINEVLAGFLAWRSKDLDAAVRRMLGDPDLINKVLDHPMIESLAGGSGRKPSYIPPNTFALAVLDAISPPDGQPSALDQMRQVVAQQVPTSKASQALVTIIDKANGDIEKARTGVSDWFNQSMDRLSGEYKRKIQYLTLLVSLIITLIMGADTLALAGTLYKEPTLRSAVTGAATAFPTTPTTSTSPTNLTEQSASVQKVIGEIGKINLPLGWSDLPTDFMGWFRKVIGLLATTLALSLGAPFWFDMLKKISNVRMTGPKPS
jgi:hypothetical protein